MLTTNPNGTPVTSSSTLTNEANVNFDVPEGQSRYLTAGNDVVDLSKWSGTVSVNIGDAFSGDNDKVTVMADKLAGVAPNNNLKLASIENLEIVNSGVEKTPVILKGANFKGLEAIKLIGDATILSVSDFTQGVKIDATANADNIIGSDKADTINGGAGNDIITGNDGNDVLTGGNGADEFVVGSIKAAGVDQILDFSAEDKITLKGFSVKELKKFDASTFSTVTYKTLDSVLATFRKDGANETKTGDVVIFSYDGKTYALLANGAFTETGSALVDITGANVASLTESNFGVSGTFENYAAFKVAVDTDKVVTPTSPATIKSITATDAAALLTTDKTYLDKIEEGGIGKVTETPVDVTMKTAVSTTLDTTGFASKLGAGVTISAINITGVAAGGNNITSSFGGKIKGGTAADTIDASAATDAVTIEGSGGADSIIGGSGADSITGGADADTIIGGAGNDTITGSGGGDSITGGSGDDTITLVSGDSATDTIVFEKDATANGVDTITGFKAGATNSGGDVLKFAEFLGTTNAKVASSGGLGNDGSGVEISSSGFDATASGAGNVIYVKDATSLDAGNFGSSAKANVIKVAANTDYVVIAKDTTNSTIYYVEVGTNVAAATVTSVGTINTPSEAFVAGNFA